MTAKPHTEVQVAQQEFCDFCTAAYAGTPAAYDGKTRQGPWAFMCEAHFRQHGVGLGLGKGQRLILQEP